MCMDRNYHLHSTTGCLPLYCILNGVIKKNNYVAYSFQGRYTGQTIIIIIIIIIIITTIIIIIIIIAVKTRFMRRTVGILEVMNMHVGGNFKIIEN